MSTDEKFLRGLKSKIKYEDECQIWSGTHVNKIFPYYNNKNVQKYLWSRVNPPLKEKIECIKTTCEKSSCVNVDHMYIYQHQPEYTCVKTHEIIWENVIKSIMSKTEKEGECIIWKGWVTSCGYGRIRCMGKNYFSHRLSYMTKIRSEDIPTHIDGEVANVMHLCGNSKCVNPDHLELGTVGENASHKIEHGTHQRGETSKRATITEETAQKILDSKRKKGEIDYQTKRQRAERFGTTHAVVRNIDARQTWGHLVDSRNNTTSVRDKINKRNREQLKLQKEIVLTDKQYEEAWKTLRSKSVFVQRGEWGCLEYTNSPKNGNGYGQFCFYNIYKQAHIWSCEIKNKRSRREGEVTMHLCNNKVCVNPEHLEFGTYKENSVYSILSGSKSCKLTPDIVREIRSSDLSCMALSRKFGVSDETIRQARDGKTWTGVN